MVLSYQECKDRNTQFLHRKIRLDATKYCLPLDYVYRKSFIICAMEIAIIMTIHKSIEFQFVRIYIYIIYRGNISKPMNYDINTFT